MLRAARRKNAFTLLEVILTISLTGVVLVLLTTALELLLFRVESSRSRVESSQLARGILNHIATDLRAARYYAPSQNSTDNTEDSSESETSAKDSGEVSQVLGIYGTAKQIRIDRASVWRWERISEKKSKVAEDASAEQMPQTVRYFINEGESVLVKQLAAQGIQAEDKPLEYAGLSRDQMSTVAWLAQLNSFDDTDEDAAATEDAQLLAPEVLDIEFAYFNGKELLEEWDSAEQGSLPQAVEITLKIANEPVADINKRPPDDPEELEPQLEAATEYRLFVRIPKLQPKTGVPGPQRIKLSQNAQ